MASSKLEPHELLTEDLRFSVSFKGYENAFVRKKLAKKIAAGPGHKHVYDGIVDLVNSGHLDHPYEKALEAGFSWVESVTIPEKSRDEYYVTQFENYMDFSNFQYFKKNRILETAKGLTTSNFVTIEYNIDKCSMVIAICLLAPFVLEARAIELLNEYTENPCSTKKHILVGIIGPGHQRILDNTRETLDAFRLVESRILRELGRPSSERQRVRGKCEKDISWKSSILEGGL